MSGGQIAQIGTPLTLYHHPATLEVAPFIGSPRMYVIPARRAAAATHFMAEMVLVENLWHETLMYHQIPDVDEPLTQRLPGDSQIKAAERVILRLSEPQCHLFALSGESL